MLLIVIGFGLATGPWLASACAAVPLPALMRLIHVEEAELTAVLGDRYCSYEDRTKRLIPGVW